MTASVCNDFTAMVGDFHQAAGTGGAQKRPTQEKQGPDGV